MRHSSATSAEPLTCSARTLHGVRVEKAGVTATALRAAAEGGRLRAQKSDKGTWLSSKKWVADYQVTNHKRITTTAKPKT